MGHCWFMMSPLMTLVLTDVLFMQRQFTFRFEVQPTDRVVAKGQPVVFQCITVNFPSFLTLIGICISFPRLLNMCKLLFSWRNHLQRLFGIITTKLFKTEVSGYSILPVSNSLEISSVESQHEGDYKCVVEGAGKRRTSLIGRLHIESDVTSHELTFLSSPRVQTAKKGDDVILECLVISHISVEVRWLKNSRQVLIDGSRIRRVGISSLLLSNVVDSDSGLYTCRASNMHDSLDRTVVVHISSEPQVTLRPENKVASEKTDVVFECMASGRPTPTISWFKNGEAIIASDYFVIEPTRLRILGLVKADQGVYQCFADNEMFYFCVEGSRFINMEWDPPLVRNGHITRYYVLYKEGNSDRYASVLLFYFEKTTLRILEAKEKITNSSSTSVTITSLHPNTLYMLRVAAENQVGMGKISDYVKVTTKNEQAVPGRVTNLSARALGPETIEVKWDPPQGGPVALRYKLFYVKNSPEPDDKETQTIISSTAYTLHGMEKFTEYQIRVEAEGENGSGLSSDPLNVRTLSDVPSSPPRDIVAETLSSSSIRVTWREPDMGSSNGEITGYRLKYKTKVRGSKGNTFMLDANEREYTITGLDVNTQYLVRMAVVNHNGTGPYSDWLPVATSLLDKEELVLGAPRELRPQAGPDYILISWLPPADESNLVRGYQIGWGNNVPDVSMERVGANVFQHKISGLRPSREYVVSLRAFNKQGSGFPIYETVKTLSPSSPFFDETVASSQLRTPVGVRAEALSATSIRVSWIESDPNAFNVVYTVRYSTKLNTHFFRTHASAPSSSPRDLTVLPSVSGDPNAVLLNWQPPKYSNGDIEEYIIYYTDRVMLADRDWTAHFIQGDKLSCEIRNLLPKTTYYFKMQARNEKGLGPLSKIQTFTPFGEGIASSGVVPPLRGTNSHLQWKDILSLLSSNPMYIAVLIALATLLLLCIILLAVCALKKTSNHQKGYTAGKRTNTQQPTVDLWIDHPSGNHIRGESSDYMMNGIGTSAVDMKNLTTTEVVQSPPPKYHAMQDSIYGTVSIRHTRTPVRQSISSHDEDLRRSHHEGHRSIVIGRAKPIIASTVGYGSTSDESQCTLPRSYHHSESSLDGQKQRTPQVAYTNIGRQAIVKVGLGDSPYGSTSALTTTPPVPAQAPPSGPPSVVDGYRTLRGNVTPSSGNHAQFRSFTQQVTPTVSHNEVQNSAQHQARPTIVATGGRQLPVGRATAQPRVNVSNIYNSCASCSSDNETDKQIPSDVVSPGNSALLPSNSTEELNAQMENLDTMIDDLQALQHEFGVVS
ncbi:fibronectin type III domain protein [Dictyocaulus viviparus]|uniref:Fibronectin type III domain protein n=1 Tax=Dictyocaulus viviparus TaxID=29172 RepID=A0A0D8YAY7_DICVI|nr:fibronectin type III domain protein [Dictyocaulus viviparus]